MINQGKTNGNSHVFTRSSGFDTEGIMRSCLLLYLEHEKLLSLGEVAEARKFSNPFCLLGCFCIELCIKDALFKAGHKKEKIKGHNIGVLLKKLENLEDNFLFEELKLFVMDNKDLCERLKNPTYNFWHMARNYLNTFDQKERYKDTDHSISTDASIVILFLYFFRDKTVLEKWNSEGQEKDVDLITISSLKSRILRDKGVTK